MTFRFFQRRATSWAPAGHEVAWQQIALDHPPRRAAAGRGVRPGERRRELVLEAGHVRAVVERKTGLLVELSRGGRRVLLDGPRLQLWRAPTDNDGIRLLQREHSGVLPRWLELGLDHVHHKLDTVRTLRDGIEVVHRASGRGRFGDAVHRQRYRLLADGGLLVDNDVLLADELRDLPRVGVVLTLPAGAGATRLAGPRPVGELLRPDGLRDRRPVSRAPSPSSTSRTSCPRSTATAATSGTWR